MAYSKSLTPISVTLLISLSLITSTLAGDCNNPLLTPFGFTALGSPTAQTGLNFCKSLQSGQSCCSADTINDFQNKANTLTTDILTVVKARDQFIVDTRDQTLPTLTNGLSSLKTAAAAAVTFLQDKVTTGDTTFDSGKALTNQQALTVNQALQRITTQVTDSLSTLKAGLTTFQTARSTCMTELLKLQASAWCLSCDPDYATKGLTTGSTTITLSDTVCTRLQTACYNYISDSVTQSNIILAKEVGAVVTDALAAVNKIGGNDATGLDDLATVLQTIESSASTTISEEAVQTPTGCTSATSCTYICTTLFSTVGGTISQDDANRGGAVNTELNDPSSGGSGSGSGGSGSGSGSGRILLDGGFLSSEPGKRVLLANEWSPDEDEAGITVSFPSDPAGVNPQTTETTTTTNSAPKLISGAFCLVGALVGALLI